MLTAGDQMSIGVVYRTGKIASLRDHRRVGDFAQGCPISLAMLMNELRRIANVVGSRFIGFSSLHQPARTRLTRRFPASSITASHPGGMTVVESACSMIAGPVIRWSRVNVSRQ